MNNNIHSTSIVDKGARIGKGTKIWHWSHISTNSFIGENCSIGQHVFIGQNVVICNNCKIQNNVSIYDGVEIGNNVFCGPSMVFTNVINPRSEINRKNEFKKTSKTLIKNRKEPKYKKVLRLDLSGFKKLTLDIIFPELLSCCCTNS